MNLIGYEDFKNTSAAADFIKNNPDIGYLKILAFTAYQAIPIADVEIIISKDFGNDKVVFFRGQTDSNGMIANIELPAPKAQYVADKDVMPPYTSYDITAIHGNFDTINNYVVGIFGDVRVIQYVKMTPSSGDTNGS